jgi:hypothetical protein
VTDPSDLLYSAFLCVAGGCETWWIINVYFYSCAPIADMKGQDIVTLMIITTLHLLLVIMTVGGEIGISA